MSFEEATVANLQPFFASGKTNSRQLAEFYLERIARIDQSGPELRSVIQVNPNALQIAESLDKERKEKGPRSILHGIPVLLKDNIGTIDGMETTAGSLALVGSRLAKESYCARRLREAGALILGKSNLSEWANFRSSNSSSGWSARGGQVRNPYALNRSPCGSSSGSAVAIAANLAMLSVGTETDGSIVCPASTNGVVGIKPTVGLTSRSGVVPISHSQDTIGPMCRTVSDAAALLGFMTGIDSSDPATAESSGKFYDDYIQFLDANGLKDSRIGVPREIYFGYSSKTDAVANSAIKKIGELGATIVDPANIPTAKQMAFSESELTVLLYEFKSDLNRYLSELENSQVRSLAEIIAFNEANSEKELVYFGQELFLKAEETASLDDPKYLQALEENHRLSRSEGIDAVMKDNDLDALVMPSNAPAWCIDYVDGDHSMGGSSQPAALAGYPAITVPAGFASGLPIGITFMGRAFSEATLIKLAYSFEQATSARRAPDFTPVIC
jgi:amidase